MLSRNNPHLRDATAMRRRRVRSLASSTAIETGESIHTLETRITHPHSRRIRVTLA